MPDSIPTKSSQPVPFLLLGILLTLVAVVGHKFLPERRLTLDSSREGANFLLVEAGNGAQSENRWLDQARFHYLCQFPQAAAQHGCGFAFMLAPGVISEGIDLSRF